MSMLAEPRRKQRWTLNPRGKQWSEDPNKFGQKMLEKMGWTSGKGLGANEQGITEHVRVSFKDDTTGIGFKKDNVDKAWTEHQDSFNNLLQKLQQNENCDIIQTQENKSSLSGKSLELKSKQSRARVHYQKFIRGKDVNKYSSKDLANIFGQKDLNVSNDDKDKQDTRGDSFNIIGSKDNRGGVITINSGNMNEYFMKKRQGSSSTIKKQQKTDSENEPEYVKFGFTSQLEKMKSHCNEESREIQNVHNYVFENPCVQLDSPETISNSNNEYKFHKKRKSDDNELSLSSEAKKFKDNICQNGIVNVGLNLECKSDEICNGKEFEVSREQFGVTNSALDLSDETDNKKRVTFNDHVEYNTDSLKKKGRTTLDKFEIENKKAKKKKKHKDTVSNPISSCFINEALDIVEKSEVNDNEINEHKSKKSKKRKANRRSNLETIPEVVEIIEISEEDKPCRDEVEIQLLKVEDNTSNDYISQGDPVKKKKKKRHTDKIEVIIEHKHEVEESAEKVVISERNTIFEKDECKIHENQENTFKKRKKNKKRDENVVSEGKIKVINIKNVEEKSKEADESMKMKKKKKTKKDDVNDLSIKTDIIVHKEIFDKENKNDIDESEMSKSKQKEHTKIQNESATNNSTHNIKFIEESAKQTNAVIKTTFSRHFNNRSDVSRPWNDKARMSKRLLKFLLQRNSISNFPGSNMGEIKGYGADI